MSTGIPKAKWGSVKYSPSEPLTAQQIYDLLIEHKRKFPDMDASSEDESDAEEEDSEGDTRVCMEDTVQGDIERDEWGDSFHQVSLEDLDIMRTILLAFHCASQMPTPLTLSEGGNTFVSNKNLTSFPVSNLRAPPTSTPHYTQLQTASEKTSQKTTSDDSSNSQGTRSSGAGSSALNAEIAPVVGSVIPAMLHTGSMAPLPAVNVAGSLGEDDTERLPRLRPKHKLRMAERARKVYRK
ncbi:hypothetical protein FA13DRAFT_1791825 [Coprinellus micaceus]|uniref:Uncharacterized protein n=1 Tax=Coprinellus micaceus TaxID=71717 RepID=A0A4Y7TAB1_COPMI|nr:hypothetical protein FA13DRAFT_1791825 [Coprinellus micaceus]